MYTITLTETFKATHYLDAIRPQPHEHDWVVTVTLASETLIEPGLVMNYFELKPAVRKTLPQGKCLNDEYPFAPTGENLAKHFYEILKPQLPQLVEVAVGEFPEFMCAYRP